MVFGGGGGTNRVRVHIVGDKTDLDKKIRSSEKGVKDSGSRMTKSLRANAAKIKIGVTVAAVAMVSIAKVAIKQAELMASAYAITEQVIKKTGGAANLTAKEIREMSKAQAFNTGISKAAITEGNNILLTFKNLRNEVGEGNNIFERASDAMLDMSTVMGTDAKSGAVQLGKALNDPITGISALTRVGVTFTDVQKEQIRNFQESGDRMSAQKIILAELESQMGGTAVAAADDSAKIARSFDEITEALGVILLPVLAEVATGFGVLTGAIDLNRGAIQTWKETHGEIPETGRDIVQALLDESKAVLGWSEVLFGGGAANKLFVDSLIKMIRSGKLSETQLKSMRGAMHSLAEEGHLWFNQEEQLTDAIALQISVLAGVRFGYTGAVSALDDLGDSTEDATEATEIHTDAQKAAIQTGVDYRTELRELVGQSDRTFSEMAGDVESFLTGFAKLPKKVHIHLAEFEANFRARAESMKSFWTNLGVLADQGLDALVDELITGGPETAMIAEEYVNDPIRAGIMNAFIEGAEQGLFQAQSRIEGFDMPDLTFELIPFVGTPQPEPEPPPPFTGTEGPPQDEIIPPIFNLDFNITGFVGNETELAAEIDRMLTRHRSEVVDGAS